MNNISVMLTKIENDPRLTDPEQIKLVKRLVLDIATLNLLDSEGKDVQSEIDIVVASAANISEHTKEVARQAMLSWVGDLITRVALTALLA